MFWSWWRAGLRSSTPPGNVSGPAGSMLPEGGLSGLRSVPDTLMGVDPADMERQIGRLGANARLHLRLSQRLARASSSDWHVLPKAV